MMKRGTDLIGGAVLLVLVLPLLLVLAVGLAWSLRAWPLFTQTRIGEDGQPFRFLKLRTLPPSAPAYADKYEIAVIELPWLAKHVRRLHLDELPQLALVVTGRMSLVGPRPEMPALHRRLPERFATARTSVKPGCTGLWQISQDANGLIHEAPLYDLLYVEYRSLALDVWILWRTVLLLTGLGAPQELAAAPHWVLHPLRDPLEIVVDLGSRELALRGSVTRDESAA